MKTGQVKSLVTEVLASIPPPYTEHVADDVFSAIENNVKWRKEYDGLCVLLGKAVVNASGAIWIANALGKTGASQLASRKSTLISSYPLLDTDAARLAKKPKEPAAIQLMSDYYQTHKSEIPASAKKYREQIVELIMEGTPPDLAFAMVLKGGG